MVGSSRKLWFGNQNHAQWVPCPATGLVKHRQRYNVELEYENGGGDVVTSNAWRSVYDFDIPLSDASDYLGIEALSRYAAGEWNDGTPTNKTNLIRFTDPMFSDTNLFNPVWAAPHLIEKGWPNFGGTNPTFAGSGTVTYNRPYRTATWNITASSGTAQGSGFVFLIPPNYTLYVSVTATVTGTAGMYLDGSPITLNSFTDTPWAHFATVTAGSNGTASTVSMRRSSSATSSITIQSMMAQIFPSPFGPVGSWHPGDGHAGLKFTGNDPVPETYTMTQNHLVGMSGVSLVEVEPWLP